MPKRTRPVKAVKAAKADRPATADLPIVRFKDQNDWRTWLEAQHASSPGVWLRIAKIKSGTASVTYQEALEVALCYGWIDGQKKPFDESSWLQKFTPRRPKSIWSKINSEKAESLIKQRLMRPAGLREIERARQDGRWAVAYHSQVSATVPEDLQSALDSSPKAKAFFATLSSGNRYAILFRIQTAKKAETRIRRIEHYVRMLENNEKIHP